MDFAFFLLLTLLLPQLALVVLVGLPVCTVVWLVKRHKRKKRPSDVTEEELEAAKRRVIVFAVLLLVTLALVWVWYYVGTHTTLSM